MRGDARGGDGRAQAPEGGSVLALPVPGWSPSPGRSPPSPELTWGGEEQVLLSPTPAASALLMAGETEAEASPRLTLSWLVAQAEGTRDTVQSSSRAASTPLSSPQGHREPFPAPGSGFAPSRRDGTTARAKGIPAALGHPVPHPGVTATQKGQRGDLTEVQEPGVSLWIKSARSGAGTELGAAQERQRCPARGWHLGV